MSKKNENLPSVMDFLVRKTINEADIVIAPKCDLDVDN